MEPATQILVAVIISLIGLGLGKLWGEAKMPAILKQIRDTENTLGGQIQAIDLKLVAYDHYEELISELKLTNKEQYILIDKLLEKVAIIEGTLSK